MLRFTTYAPAPPRHATTHSVWCPGDGGMMRCGGSKSFTPPPFSDTNCGSRPWSATITPFSPTIETCV